jgi:citronellol/citronellal dehydrogenase
VAAEIRDAGGEALPLAVDIRDEEQLAEAVKETVRAFDGIDILVNNASALFLADTANTPMKRFDLMFDINVRGTYAASQAALPHLAKAANPHILTLSPPLQLNQQWFADHCAYTMSKYGMSMCVLGMAHEFRSKGIAVNALWPRYMIQTAASSMLAVDPEGCRSADIMADAAHAILSRASKRCTGNFYLDDEVLAEEGVQDFDHYRLHPATPLIPDLFVA